MVFYAASVVTWFLARRSPKSVLRYASTLLIFGGSGMVPPATVHNYLCWDAVGWVFNWFIKRRHRGWWLQYKLHHVGGARQRAHRVDHRHLLRPVFELRYAAAVFRQLRRLRDA
ncbi:hypothetical protein DL765_010055 [Monosporascus sp. GIB2]|nr:hypothetical protein DL765_010055 [Monosporascus sp. GIB2]